MSTWYLHWTASTWMIINTEKLFEVMWLKDVNSSHLNIHKKSSVFNVPVIFSWVKNHHDHNVSMSISLIFFLSLISVIWYPLHLFHRPVVCVWFFFFLNQKSSKCVAYDIYHGSDYYQYYKLRTTVSYFSLY